MPPEVGHAWPNVVVLAGPNGAGKTTCAPALLQGQLAVEQFVNADELARGLAGFAPESAAVPAGRIMLARLRELARQRVDFAFETTLASRSFATWLKTLTADGYRLRLLFLWLPSAECAVARVANRVRLGGHAVPEETVRRRYRAGIRNFWRLYRPIATDWRVYDNSEGAAMRLVACGRHERVDVVCDRGTWLNLQRLSENTP